MSYLNTRLSAPQSLKLQLDNCHNEKGKETEKGTATRQKLLQLALYHIKREEP